jgi:hypothetical protein
LLNSNARRLFGTLIPRAAEWLVAPAVFVIEKGAAHDFVEKFRCQRRGCEID